MSYGRCAAVKVTHAPRHAGHSKYSIPKLVALTLNFICNFSIWPVRFATFVGAAFFIVAVIALLVIGIAAVISPEVAFGLPLLAAAMLLLSSVQLLFIGILGEYISRIYVEAKGRPHFVIREVLDHHAVGDTESGEGRSFASWH